MRHWTMLRLVPRHPIKTTSAALTKALLAEGFNISKRSVERDIDLLSADFPLICDDRAKPYGWSWKADAKPLHLPGLQAHEALVFKLAEAHLTALMPTALRGSLEPYFKLADQRLRATDAHRGPASWPSKVRVVSPTQPLLPPKVSEAIFRAVTQALLDGVQLLARYMPRGADKPTEYRLNPLGLIHRSPVSYLVATAWDYNDPHIFALHRFTSAKLLEQAARSTPTFDLDEYIRGGALGFQYSNEPLRLVARFQAAAAEHLRETPLAQDQTLKVTDGHVVLTATVPDTAQLRWWLLGFGDNVEVLAPPALRQEIAIAVEAMAAQYGGP
jgi:predicted DNA-binding transcriptional regulator YafY